MRDSLLSEIMALKALSAKELKEKYEALFNGERPASTYKVYLWRQIAYRMQEMAYGGLSEEAQGKIKELVQEYDPINNKTLRPEKSPQEKKRSTRDRRLPIPGTFLVKEYKGKAIQVKVLEKGFEYEGAIYKTLSKVAKVVTGSHWNGYVFFGL